MAQAYATQDVFAGNRVIEVRVRAPRGLEGMRLTRRGRVVVWTLAFLLDGLAVLLGVRAGADGVPQAQEVGQHAVQAGETLWSVAASVGADRDIRDVMEEIIALNGRTGSTLYAGEIILLPRY